LHRQILFTADDLGAAKATVAAARLRAQNPLVHIEAHPSEVTAANVRALVTGRTRTIGVVLPALSRWFFARVLEGIQDALLERRYDLALYGAPPNSPTRREMFEHFLSRKRFDGIIAVGIEPRTHELERLVDFGKPVVSVGGYDAGTNAVSIDDTAAGRRFDPGLSRTRINCHLFPVDAGKPSIGPDACRLSGSIC